MPTQIELTLSSLLPTVSPLPPELIELSASLLAQSRSKAAQLKPEEEIARTYACCHIACQRLGHRLALEIAPPAPPVKPRVYQKLHSYFNSALATPKPGRKKAAAEAQPSGKDAGGDQSTPKTTRKRLVEESVTTPASSAKRRKRNEETGVPHYVMPMIRHLCREFDAPEAAPHAYAGVQSILFGDESFRHENSSINPAASVDTENMILTSLIGVFDAVYGMMRPSHHANKRTKKNQHARMVKAVKEYCLENIDSLPFHNGEDATVTLALEPIADDCDVPELWKRMEWYQNIPDGDALEHDRDRDENPSPTKHVAKTPIRRQKGTKKADPDADEESGAAGLLPGLGTMFQPAIDWLSDERRAQYSHWRKDIGKRMALSAAQRV